MHKIYMNEAVSGKFSTGTEKQEGGLSLCVCCIPIGSTEHDEVTACRSGRYN